jgi:hypothetical protein
LYPPECFVLKALSPSGRLLLHFASAFFAVQAGIPVYSFVHSPAIRKAATSYRHRKFLLGETDAEHWNDSYREDMPFNLAGASFADRTCRGGH